MRQLQSQKRTDRNFKHKSLVNRMDLRQMSLMPRFKRSGVSSPIQQPILSANKIQHSDETLMPSRELEQRKIMSLKTNQLSKNRINNKKKEARPSTSTENNLPLEFKNSSLFVPSKEIELSLSTATPTSVISTTP